MDENADQSSSFWDLIQKQWRFLFNGAVWLFDIVATFVIPPAFLDESWINFTRFVVAVLTGLYSIAAATWPGRKHTAIWVGCIRRFCGRIDWELFRLRQSFARLDRDLSSK
jgi:hypothetical protein